MDIGCPNITLICLNILRPIPAYLIHKYTKIYDKLFNQQSIYSPFIQQKGIHELYPALIRYAGQPPALDLYLKGGVPRRGEQSPVVIISYKGYSPPKCTCNGNQTHSSKFMILLECLHALSMLRVLTDSLTHPTRYV